MTMAGVLLTAGACAADGADVQSMPPDRAKSQVHRLAEQVRTAVAVESFSQADENVSPCEGRDGELSDAGDVYYIQGIYQLLVPAADQDEALARVRRQAPADGLEIKSERSFGSGAGGELTAANTDGYAVSLTSGQPPAMQLLVSSPCYRT
jgi:hypothetical protein